MKLSECKIGIDVICTHKSAKNKKGYIIDFANKFNGGLTPIVRFFNYGYFPIKMPAKYLELYKD